MLWSIGLVLLLRCMLARVHIIHNVKLLLLLLLMMFPSITVSDNTVTAARFRQWEVLH